MKLMVKLSRSNHQQGKLSNSTVKIIFLKNLLLLILLLSKHGELMKEEIFNLENLQEISTKMLLQLERYV